MKKKDTRTLAERAKNDQSGRLKIHMRVGYKDGIILVRQIDEEVFLWDAVWRGDIFGNYFIITLPKGKKTHEEKILNEVRQMCYAGAAATIDELRGDEMSTEDKKNVEVFEANREKIDKPVKAD